MSGTRSTQSLDERVDRCADETHFSGVVRVDVDGEPFLARAYGHAHRGHRLPNRTDTQLAIASGSKAMTALVVVSLVADGALALNTTARSVLGDDLPLIADDVTVEHLLCHRSGIGDYLAEDDEQDITDHVLAAPLHELDHTEAFLPMLDGHPTVFAAGERFEYNNGGYVVLALIAERVSGVAFHDLVVQRVCVPAGMDHTAYLRADELPPSAATNYLSNDRPRTNVFHLPVRGNGDGGIYSTVGDVHALWRSFFAGRIVTPEWVSVMVRPRSGDRPGARYGLGIWLHGSSDVAMLEGYDAGVSFRTVHDPGGAFTHTVISNTSEGAWPLTRLLDELVGGG